MSANANHHVVHIIIKSRYSEYQTQLDFIVLPKVTHYLSISKTDVSSLQFPKHIFLADPKFHIPNKTDILIGAELFYDLLCVGQIRISLAMDGLLLEEYLQLS